VTNGDAVRQFPLQLFVTGGGQEPDDPKLAVDFEEVDAVEHRDVVVQVKLEDFFLKVSKKCFKIRRLVEDCF
jgi:hypothetical protein